MTETLENKSSNLKKFFLLALSFYLFLYCFPFPLTYIPNSIETLEWMAQPIDWFSHWFGKSVMQISSLRDTQFYYGGDTIFQYVKLVALPVLSLLLGTVVFVFSYRKTDYKKFYKWIIVYIRYNLGTNLFINGSAMLFSYINYGSLDMHALEKPMGDYNTYELFWTFIGYSKGYLIFLGIIQIIIGSLLFFKKTTALGSFLAIVFFLNIVAYNFAYGFSTKIYSMHSLLFALIIISPNIKTILSFFVANKTSTLKMPIINLASKEMRVMRIIAKYSFLILLLIQELTRLSNNTQENYPLTGSYRTIHFVSNGDTLGFDIKKGIRWEKLVIDKGKANIHWKGRVYDYLNVKIDTLKNELLLINIYDTTKLYKFDYKAYREDVFSYLDISGIYYKDTIKVHFRKKSYEEFELVKNKFEWIAK